MDIGELIPGVASQALFGLGVDHEHQPRVRAAFAAFGVCDEAVTAFNENAVRTGLLSPTLVLQSLKLRAPRMRQGDPIRGRGSAEEAMRQLAV